MTTMPDVAYFYPQPYWSMSEDGWAKSMLLFFDQLAILLPDYMYGRHHSEVPYLTPALEERGLLQVLEPKSWIDDELARQLVSVLLEMVRAGSFDNLPVVDEGRFAALSQSRMAYHVSVELGESLFDALAAKGLAAPSVDGVSIPLHPWVRLTILVVLGQLARVAGAKRKLAVHPTTSNQSAVNDLVNALSHEPWPTAGNVVVFDAEPVALDLGPVPLDDVLAFRDEYGNAHRTYMRDVHRFMAEVSSVDSIDERKRLLLDRTEEIQDAAHSLRRSSRRALGMDLASWSLGIAGAAWSAANSDPIGALLGLGGITAPLAVKAAVGVQAPPTVYSYIFDAGRRWGTVNR